MFPASRFEVVAQLQNDNSLTFEMNTKYIIDVLVKIGCHNFRWLSLSTFLPKKKCSYVKPF